LKCQEDDVELAS